MRLSVVLGAAAVLSAMAGGANAASVEIKNAVARVTVVPENRSDVRVEVLKSHPQLPLAVRTEGGRTVIDGNLGRRIGSCRAAGGEPHVEVRGVGGVDFRDMPQVVVHTPRDAYVQASGAVFGSVGRSGNLELGNAGCGDWTLANVEGRLRVNEAGSGNVRAGAAGDAHVRVAGSGDVWLTDIRGPLGVDIAGSGNVSVGSLDGPLDARVAGSGDIRIRGGHASSMAVAIAGSGDLEFGGVAESLRARIMGSGDVHVKAVKGPISKMVMGSGGVSVGG